MRIQFNRDLDFETNHICSIPLDKYGYPLIGTIGGSITYNITPTSLGDIVKVKCICGANKDLTDYEEW